MIKQTLIIYEGKNVNYRLTNKFPVRLMVRRLAVIRVRHEFFSVLVGPNIKLTSTISALKSRCKPSIVSCRKTVPGDRKRPEGKIGGRLFKKVRLTARMSCNKKLPARGDSWKESAVW